MNQVEVKEDKYRVFPMSLPVSISGCSGKASEITAWDIWQRLFWYLPCSGCLPGKSAGQNGQNASGQKCQGAVSECLQNA